MTIESRTRKKISKMAQQTTPIRKGYIAICGLYDGTAVPVFVKKENYTQYAKTVKEGGRTQINSFLKEFGTKEKVADFLEGQLIEFHNAILAISDHVDDDVLERAWGEDWKGIKLTWNLNISSLLHLKRIKNDEMNGWMLIDHNSIQLVFETGNVNIVGGTDMKKLLKKANALKQQSKK